MSGRERWFYQYNNIGQDIQELRQLFQNEINPQDIENWAKKAIELEKKFNSLNKLTAMWLTATQVISKW